jgi:hypothetical protein
VSKSGLCSPKPAPLFYAQRKYSVKHCQGLLLTKPNFQPLHSHYIVLTPWCTWLKASKYYSNNPAAIQGNVQAFLVINDAVCTASMWEAVKDVSVK